GDERAQPVRPPAGHGRDLEFLLLHHGQRVDGDGPDPGGGHSHAAFVLWRLGHADGDVRLRPFDERAYPPAGGNPAPFRWHYLIAPSDLVRLAWPQTSLSRLAGARLDR